MKTPEATDKDEAIHQAAMRSTQELKAVVFNGCRPKELHNWARRLGAEIRAIKNQEWEAL